MIRDDLQAQVEVLTNLGKKYSDAGPVFDCVVFNDGEVWRYALTCLMEGSRDSCLPHDFHNILWTVILLLTVQISRVYHCFSCMSIKWAQRSWLFTVSDGQWARISRLSMPGQPCAHPALASHCWPSKYARPALVSHC